MMHGALWVTKFTRIAIFFFFCERNTVDFLSILPLNLLTHQAPSRMVVIIFKYDVRPSPHASVRPSQKHHATALKQHMPQRYMGPGGSL